MKYIRTLMTLALQELGKIERNYAIANVKHAIFIEPVDKYFTVTFIVDSDNYLESLIPNISIRKSPVVPIDITASNGQIVVFNWYDMYPISDEDLENSYKEFWQNEHAK